ncbi:YjgP/YjgQ family permease [Prolixibacteraceae bacterium JC049]|nr:YjgP/YjgQ family permease [Prolixibacteraceae bacterium JC049]
MLRKIDFYIIRKFLGTFFYAIALIISIAIIFDFSEKIDEFIEYEAPMRAIIFDYYMNFAPYFANLFSGLFTFIAVIFFTSKLAYNSEIIAILSSGVSFRRLMRPYMASATIIAIFSWTLSSFVIPSASATKFEFEKKYVNKKKDNTSRNVHLQVEPGVYIYLNSYTPTTDVGHKFTIEKFENGALKSKLKASSIRWDREKKIWQLNQYTIRDFVDGKEILTSGEKKDTTISMLPEDFSFYKYDVETLNYFDLNEEIREQKLRGVGSVINFEIEKHKRNASAFSAFILTIIGASLASRKIRGGIGLHLGLGLLLSFSYIMFQQITKVFALSGSVNAFMAAWIPNFIYAIIAIVLYRKAAR